MLLRGVKTSCEMTIVFPGCALWKFFVEYFEKSTQQQREAIRDRDFL